MLSAFRAAPRGTRSFHSFQTINRGVTRKNVSSVVKAVSVTGIGAWVMYHAPNMYFRTRCEWEGEEAGIKVREFAEAHRKFRKAEEEWDLTTIFQIIWRAIMESPLLTLSTIITGILSALIPLLIPRGSRKFLDIARDQDADFSDLIRPTIELVSIGVASAIASVVDYCLLTELISRIHLKLSLHLFSSFLRQDISFFDKIETAELMSRLDADLNNIVSTLKHTFSSGLRNSITLVGGTVSLFLMDAKLASVLSIALPAMVGIGSLYTRQLRKLSKSVREEHTQVVGSAHESLSLIKTIRAFGREDFENDKFEENITKEKQMSRLLGRGIGILHGLSFLGITGALTLVLSFGGYLITIGEMTSGLVSEFLFQAFHLQRSIMEVAILGGEFTRASSAMERVNQLLASRPQIPLKEGIELNSERVEGTIEFENISFTYPTRPDRIVIDNLSLTIPAGKIYAIVGPSGSGKSTLLSLIERFYDVDRGTIRLDERDIRDLNATCLRKQIGIVSQEPALFDTSIFENVRYGKPDATEEEVVEACKRANCHHFIMQFANGYDTPVGERGAQLSGGQKQRIAIARALLLDPKILILDEATSSLDTESEKLVQEALERVMKGRTVLIVAHRLSTIRNADKIVVLKDGSIVEQGTHSELLDLNQVYAKHVATQMKE